ncbi:MAG: hypothetical protein ACLVJH_15920 [Faecalibacterium prausnitzii]
MKGERDRGGAGLHPPRPRRRPGSQARKEHLGRASRITSTPSTARARWSSSIKDSYRNMREKIEPHMHLIDTGPQAPCEAAGVTRWRCPSAAAPTALRLSYMGLPCPNLCTGGFNFHGVLRVHHRRADGPAATEILLNIISCTQSDLLFLRKNFQRENGLSLSFNIKAAAAQCFVQPSLFI